MKQTKNRNLFLLFQKHLETIENHMVKMTPSIQVLYFCHIVHPCDSNELDEQLRGEMDGLEWIRVLYLIITVRSLRVCRCCRFANRLLLSI